MGEISNLLKERRLLVVARRGGVVCFRLSSVVWCAFPARFCWSLMQTLWDLRCDVPVRRCPSVDPTLVCETPGGKYSFDCSIEQDNSYVFLQSQIYENLPNRLYPSYLDFDLLMNKEYMNRNLIVNFVSVPCSLYQLSSEFISNICPLPMTLCDYLIFYIDNGNNGFKQVTCNGKQLFLKTFSELIGDYGLLLMTMCDYLMWYINNRKELTKQVPCFRKPPIFEQLLSSRNKFFILMPTEAVEALFGGATPPNIYSGYNEHKPNRNKVKCKILLQDPSIRQAT